MAKCKGCGAEILWITTILGKQMPCNAEKTTIFLENGTTSIGYIPHWATCPEYKKFKVKAETKKEEI